jgi:aspartokinase-like uncharacterized kinase
MPSIEEQINGYEEQIKSLKDAKKELENKFTFVGLYGKVAGRKNILRDLQQNKDLSDANKFEKAVEILDGYVSELKESLEITEEETEETESEEEPEEETTEESEEESEEEE